MKKIFVASKNKGKISEIKEFLLPLGYEVFSLLDTPGIPEIEESGSTFEENALIKAKEEGGSDLSARALKDLLKKENVK